MDFSLEKQKVADLLNIPNNDNWDLVDMLPEKHLYLAHYSYSSDKEKYGHIRGLLVDTQLGLVICKSYRYIPTVYMDEIKPDVEGRVELTNLENNASKLHQDAPKSSDEASGSPKMSLAVTKDAETGEKFPIYFNLKNTHLQIGYEGTAMRVIKHRGQVYHLTHRHLKTAEATWGASPSFKQLYSDLGGPSDDQLFLKNCDSSPYCHIFTLVHPTLMCTTRQYVGRGYLIYAGCQKMYGEESVTVEGVGKQKLNQEMQTRLGPIEAEPADISCIKNLNIAKEMPDITEMTPPFIYIPKPFNLLEANQHLKYGFHHPETLEKYGKYDVRHNLGGFVLVLDDKQQIKYRIQSSGSTFRNRLMHNQPDTYKQYVILSRDAFVNNPKDREIYNEKYPILPKITIKDLESYLMSEKRILIWPTHVCKSYNNEMKNHNDFAYNVFANFILSMPFHLQRQSLGYKIKLDKEKNLLSDFLYRLAVDGTSTNKYYSRVGQIISQAKKFAADRKYTGEDYLNSVGESIDFFLNCEDGPSLWKLLQQMKLRESEDTSYSGSPKMNREEGFKYGVNAEKNYVNKNGKSSPEMNARKFYRKSENKNTLGEYIVVQRSDENSSSPAASPVSSPQHEKRVVRTIIIKKKEKKNDK